MAITALPAGKLLRPTQLRPEGRFQLIDAIGAGGFGRTYRAVDTQEAGRTVVIKEFGIHEFCERQHGVDTIGIARTGDPALDDPRQQAFESWRGKFLEEARTLFGLRSRYVPNVYDLWEENGTAYYAMEDVGHRRLHAPDEEAFRARAWADVEPYALELLAALGEVHDAGIAMHGDVKPANIMLGSDGVIRLIDFGAARKSSVLRKTVTSRAFSPGYASPEQQMIGHGEVGPWSDLYGWAMVVLSLLDAHPTHDGVPYEAATRDAVNRAGGADPYVGLASNPRVTAAVPAGPWISTLERCLSLDPTARPRSANDVFRLLGAHAPLASERVVAGASGANRTQLETTSGPHVSQPKVSSFGTSSSQPAPGAPLGVVSAPVTPATPPGAPPPAAPSPSPAQPAPPSTPQPTGASSGASRAVLLVVLLLLVGAVAIGAAFLGPMFGDDCGDGVCEEGEDCASCEQDCGCDDALLCEGGACVAPAVCGDGACETARGESCNTCAADCGCAGGEVCHDDACAVPTCGDGWCAEGRETCETCGADCGCADDLTCRGGACVAASCGDGVCDANEDCASCAADCGCAAGAVCEGGSCRALVCGDDICEAGETCDSCEADCGCGDEQVCADGVCQNPVCGDGVCSEELGEDCRDCEEDCGCRGGRYCRRGRCMSQSSCLDLCDRETNMSDFRECRRRCGR